MFVLNGVFDFSKLSPNSFFRCFNDIGAERGIVRKYGVRNSFKIGDVYEVVQHASK